MQPEERANALKFAACDGSHGIGMGFVALGTVLPLLFGQLGADKVRIGLLGTVGMAGFIIGQPLGLVLLGRRRRNKGFFIRWVLGGWTGMHAVMAAGLAYLAVDRPELCQWMILALYAVVTFGDGMILPLWIDWQGSMFAQGSRGRAMGMIAGAWALGNGLGSLAAGTVQKGLAFPLNYTSLFALAACMFAFSTTFLWRLREPEWIAAPGETLRFRDLRGFVASSLRDRNFRRYMVSRMLLGMGGAGAAFFAVHFKATEGGSVGAASIIRLGALTAASQFIASNCLGRLGDRMGHKIALLLGAGAQLGALAVAYLAQGPFACGMSFFLIGTAWSAGWVSHNNMLFETCPHGHRASHIALSNTLLGPFVMLSPLALGWLMKGWGMGAGIGLCLVPTALGILWLVLLVREPRRAGRTPEPPRH